MALKYDTVLFLQIYHHFFKVITQTITTTKATTTTLSALPPLVISFLLPFFLLYIYTLCASCGNNQALTFVSDFVISSLDCVTLLPFWRSLLPPCTSQYSGFCCYLHYIIMVILVMYLASYLHVLYSVTFHHTHTHTHTHSHTKHTHTHTPNTHTHRTHTPHTHTTHTHKHHTHSHTHTHTHS